MGVNGLTVMVLQSLHVYVCVCVYVSFFPFLSLNCFVRAYIQALELL